MKIVWFVVIGLTALVALMAVIGLCLSRDHVASRSQRFAVPREVVWNAIRDVARFPEWRGDVKTVDVLSPAGGLARFREHGRHGAILYEITEDHAPARLVTRIADDSLPYGGTWTLEIASVDGGSELTITERGFVKNPIFRFLSKTVFSPTATIEKYLAALQVKLAGGPSAR